MQKHKIKLNILTFLISLSILANHGINAQRKAPKCAEDSVYFMVLDIKNMLVGAEPEAVSLYMLKSDHKFVVDSMMLEMQEVEKKMIQDKKYKQTLNAKIKEKDQTIKDKETIIAGKNKEISNLEQEKKDLKSKAKVLQESIDNYETKKELAKQKFTSLTKQIIRDNSADIKTLEQTLAYGELIEANTNDIQDYLNFRTLLAEANKMFELKYDDVKIKKIIQKIDATNLDRTLFGNILDDAELVKMDLEDYKKYTCNLKKDLQNVFDDGLSEKMTKVEIKQIKLNQPDRYPFLYNEAEYAENNLRNRLADFDCE